MKLVRIAAGLAGAGMVVALVGCPLTGLPGSSTPTPTPFTAFPAGTLLDGMFTFQGKSPTQTLNVDAKVPGSSGRLGQTQTNSDGDFFWTSFTNAPSPASPLQIVWDDSENGAGNTQAADQNTMALWVSDPLTSPPAALTTPQVTQDLYWVANAQPANATQATVNSGLITFSFTPNTNLSNVQYQVSVFKSASSNTACWSSKLAPNTSVQWDQTCGGSTTTGGGTAIGQSSFAWQIKFVENGGSFGGSNAYGSTKFISNTF